MGNTFLQGEFASSASVTDLGHFSLTQRSGVTRWSYAQLTYLAIGPKLSVLTKDIVCISPQDNLLLSFWPLLTLPAEAPACFAVLKEGYGEDIIGDLSSSFILSSSTSMFWPWIWLFYSTRVSEHLVYHNALSRSEIKKVFTGTSLVKTLNFYYRGGGSIPGWGTKIPRVARCCQKINN